jgi:hypothetical protein
VYAQAQIAGITMRPPESIVYSGVVLHDQSNAMRVGDPRSTVQVEGGFDEFGQPSTRSYTPEDRTVEGAVSGRTQRAMSFGNRSMRNADTYAHLTYRNRDPNNHDPRSSSSYRSLRNTTATVDVTGYMQALRDRGYCFYGDQCANQRQDPFRW